MKIKRLLLNSRKRLAPWSPYTIVFFREQRDNSYCRNLSRQQIERIERHAAYTTTNYIRLWMLNANGHDIKSKLTGDAWK